MHSDYLCLGKVTDLLKKYTAMELREKPHSFYKNQSESSKVV